MNPMSVTVPFNSWGVRFQAAASVVQYIFRKRIALNRKVWDSLLRFFPPQKNRIDLGWDCNVHPGLPLGLGNIFLRKVNASQNARCLGRGRPGEPTAPGTTGRCPCRAEVGSARRTKPFFCSESPINLISFGVKTTIHVEISAKYIRTSSVFKQT